MTTSPHTTEKDTLNTWSAHSAHDIQHLAIGVFPRWDRAMLKEAQLGAQQHRVPYHSLLSVIEMSIRLSVVERELQELRQAISKSAVEESTYLSAEEYPLLAELWDNEYDDTYDQV